MPAKMQHPPGVGGRCGSQSAPGKSERPNDAAVAAAPQDIFIEDQLRDTLARDGGE